METEKYDFVWTSALYVFKGPKTQKHSKVRGKFKVDLQFC